LGGEVYKLKRVIVETLNLELLLRGARLSVYQTALAINEYSELKKELMYLREELSKLHQPVVSGAVCSCNELPGGEIAVSSKALQKPYGDLGQTDC
jgi:hypothetical protein